MRSVMVVVGTMALWLTGSVALAAEPPELAAFDFLIGEWASAGFGQPGSAAGTAVFDRGLQGRVILRTSYAEYPPGDGKPGSRHDDLMVIYVSPPGVRADYYDSEGHTIRYSVHSPASGEAVFLSEPVAGQPTFRLSYKLVSRDSLDGVFEIAPPGSPGTFNPYLSWHSQRVLKTAK